jgi:hypothetical protein
MKFIKKESVGSLAYWEDIDAKGYGTTLSASADCIRIGSHEFRGHDGRVELLELIREIVKHNYEAELIRDENGKKQS